MPAAASFLSPEEARAGAVLRGMRRGAEALTGAALLEAHGRRLLLQAAAAAEARRVRRGRLDQKRQSRERERDTAAAATAAASGSSSPPPSSSPSLSPSARPFAPANSYSSSSIDAAARRRRTPPRGAAAVGDGDRSLSDAASVRAQAAAAMASVLDQGAVLVAPALPGPPPPKRGEKRGKARKNRSAAAVAAASARSRWAQGVAGLGTLAALSGLPRLIVPLPVAEAAAKLFPSTTTDSSSSSSPPPSSPSSSSSSSSFRLPPGPPPCVALLGGKGSDGNLINVGARLAPVLAEEFVRAVAAGRARAAAAAEGGSVNGADEEGQGAAEAAAAAAGRRSRRAAAAGGATPTTATAGASPATSSPASPAKSGGGGGGSSRNSSRNRSGGEGGGTNTTAEALVAEALRDEGNAAFRSGDFASAVAHYSAAAAADPTCPLALSNRAAAHLKLLDYEAAERDATLALALDHRQPKALLRRGMARAALSGGAGAMGAGVGGPLDDRRERQLLAGARGDLEAVLALEPGNRQARAELEALRVMQEPATTAATRNETEPCENEDKEENGKPGGRSSAPPSPSVPQDDFFV